MPNGESQDYPLPEFLDFELCEKIMLVIFLATQEVRLS